MTVVPAIKKASLNPNLKDFWRTKADIKILKGGRASSKTWDIAGFAVFLASQYRVKFLCCRQFQSKIQESVYAILVIQIERFGLSDEFDILKTVIRHKVTGSEFHFYGIHRNIAEIKGFEGANILWIEEGEGLTKKQWVTIEPTIRSNGAECWISYNPRLVDDYIETFFKHDPENGTIIRHINYDENPFLSATMLKKINLAKERDYDDYEHIYLGLPLSDDDKVIIKRSWIEAAVDAHFVLEIEPSDISRIGYDVADSGLDKNSMIGRHGYIANYKDTWDGGEDELMESSWRVYEQAIIRKASINYDSIGVGAGCGSNFKSFNNERKNESGYEKIEYSKFVAGGGVFEPDEDYTEDEGEPISNKDFFENAKAQAWWHVAKLFLNTYLAITKGKQFEEHELISLSSDIGDLSNLIKELSTPRKSFSKNGKVMVESKEALAKRDVKSPNEADAFIMAYAPFDETDAGGLIDLMF